MKDKMKSISVAMILLILAVVLSFGIHQRLQSPTQTDQPESEAEKQTKVHVEDIETEDLVDVPKIQNLEQNQEDQEEKSNIETTLKVDEPTVPPTPKSPEKETEVKLVNEDIDTKVEVIPESEDKVKEGDEEENPKPPKYEEPPKAEETKQPENPVIVTPEVPKDTDGRHGENLVPDNENPFLKPPSEVPSNGEGGEMKGEDYYQDGGKAGEGDKF
jgi:hypothetical protein